MAPKSDRSGGAVLPEISIIIVNWNACALLRDCLQSIAAETLSPHEIIVVDNASDDGSTQMLRSEYGDVELIANDVNRGFAAANNQGIARATGRYVLLLNPDTLILDGAIDAMIRWSDAHPDVGCVGCQVYESESTIQRTCFQDLSPLNLLLLETGLHRSRVFAKLLGRARYADWDRRTERDVDVVSGMFMLVRRKFFDTVGMLDESFFVYAEEADWCRRIRRAGHRCVFSPAGRILHRDGGSKSTDQIKPQMYVQLQKSKLIFIRKHYGAAGWLLAKLIFLGSMMTRYAFHGVRGSITRDGNQTARSRLALTALRFHLFRTDSTT